ncbi:MAG: hypothetical protein IT425_06450 [Pirellulales bacterium]|nr:hypothetical protein [Pirellulales bacterium]
MQDTGYTEVGRLSLNVESTPAYNASVPIQLRNDHDFTVRVVIMAHRQHDLNEHRNVLPGNSTVDTFCEKGQVVIIVFNVNSDKFHSGHVLDVSGSFCFVIP